MPILDAPLSLIPEEDAWKRQVTDTIRELEFYTQKLESLITELEKRVNALE